MHGTSPARKPSHALLLPLTALYLSVSLFERAGAGRVQYTLLLRCTPQIRRSSALTLNVRHAQRCDAPPPEVCYQAVHSQLLPSSSADSLLGRTGR